MKPRKIAEMIMLFSLVYSMLTSFFLHTCSLRRSRLKTDQHAKHGFFFLIAGFRNIYYNWDIISSSMNNKAREMPIQFKGSFSRCPISLLW